MTRLLVALACLLASASSQTTTNLPGVGERLHGKKPAGTGTSLRAKQLRAVLSWHCGRSVTSQYHIEDKPCQNFRFMQDSRSEEAGSEPRRIDSAACLASKKAEGAPLHPGASRLDLPRPTMALRRRCAAGIGQPLRYYLKMRSRPLSIARQKLRAATASKDLATRKKLVRGGRWGGCWRVWLEGGAAGRRAERRVRRPVCNAQEAATSS